MKPVKYTISNEFIKKLDPCPFCGGEAAGTFYAEQKEGDDGFIYLIPVVEIGCTKCPARMSLTDDLVKKWNARKKVDGRSKRK